MLASWNSYSKSDTARRPRRNTLAFCSLAKCASNVEKPTTSTFGRCLVTSCASSTRCSRGNSGFFLGLAATAMITWSNRREARSTRSPWPLVIGSKVPGYNTRFIASSWRSPLGNRMVSQHYRWAKSTYVDRYREYPVFSCRFQTFGQCARQLRGQSVHRQLRVGANAGGEQRAIVDRQVAQLMMATQAVGNGIFWVFTHGATAHHVGAAQGGAMQFQVQTVDHAAGFGQVVHKARVVMQVLDRFGPRRELNLGHAVEGPAQAVPGVG